jgi:hypothetical protein
MRGVGGDGIALKACDKPITGLALIGARCQRSSMKKEAYRLTVMGGPIVRKSLAQLTIH